MSKVQLCKIVECLLQEVFIFVAKRKSKVMMKTLMFLNQKNQHCFGYCSSTIVANYIVFFMM